MNTFEELVLQGVHSARFSSFFSPFLYFEHMCLENINFNKIIVPPLILLKKHLDG